MRSLTDRVAIPRVYLGAAERRSAAARALARFQERWRQIGPLAGTGILLALTSLVAGIAIATIRLEHVSSLFIIPVLIAAVRWGRQAALAAAAAGIAIGTLFYVPHLSFTVAGFQDIVDLVVFAGVALVTSRLADDLRRTALAARQRERVIRDTYDLAHDLLGARAADEIYEAVALHLGRVLGRPLALVVAAPGAPARVARSTLARPLRSSLVASLAGTPIAPKGGIVGMVAPDEPGLLYAIDFGGADHLVVVLDLADERGQRLGAAPDDALVERVLALLREAAESLQRLGLAKALEERATRARTDALRDMLVASVSHELRTPLAGIVGAATVLADTAAVAVDPRLSDLARSIVTESARLDARIQNLLDLSRIRSGALVPKRQWIEVADLVNAAIASTHERTRRHRVVLDCPAEVPLLMVDPTLLEQALVNVIENAAKFAPDGSTITLSVAAGPDSVSITVTDEGPGLSSEVKARMFEPFFSGDGGAARPGSGLGLAIARAFVAAHGGFVAAESGPQRGTAVTIRLPTTGAQPREVIDG